MSTDFEHVEGENPNAQGGVGATKYLCPEGTRKYESGLPP